MVFRLLLFAILISSIIAVIITFIFYRKEFLLKISAAKIEHEHELDNKYAENIITQVKKKRKRRKHFI